MRKKRNEDNLRDLWGTLHHHSLIGVPEGEERKDLRKIFGEIIAKRLS